MTSSDDVIRLVDRIKPLLAGQDSVLQGAALADLLAIWLAGHVVHGNPRATRDMRAMLLDEHIAAVGKLIEINAKIMGTDT